MNYFDLKCVFARTRFYYRMLCVVISMISLAALCSCSFAVDSNLSNQSATQRDLDTIVIEPSSTLPVFSGTTTTGFLVIRNDSDHTIEGINYEALTNDKDHDVFVTDEYDANSLKATKHHFVKMDRGFQNVLSKTSATQCGILTAHSSCRLYFKTPLLSDNAPVGSMLISATFNDGGKDQKISTLINYHVIHHDTEDGVLLSSDLPLQINDKKIGGTIYVYGSGVDKEFLMESIGFTDSSLKFVDSEKTIRGRQITSNMVVPLEISSGGDLSVNCKSCAFYNQLTVNSLSLDSGVHYSNVGGVSIAPTTVPLLGLSGTLVADTNPNGVTPVLQMIVTNYSSNAMNLASLGGLNFYPSGSGISVSTGAGKCGTQLPGNSSCFYYLSLPSGSANSVVATLSYNSVSNPLPSPLTTSAYIVWYNSQTGPLAGFSLSASPFLYSGSVPSLTNESVTLTNPGGFTMNIVESQVSFKVASGLPITAQLNGSISCKSQSGMSTDHTLQPNGSCNVPVTIVSSSVQASGYTALLGTANFRYTNSSGQQQTYSRSFLIPTMAYMTGYPIVTLTATTDYLNIPANGVGSAITTLTLSNSSLSPSAVTIPNESVVGLISDITAGANSCANYKSTSLPIGSSCSRSFVFGPTFYIESGSFYESMTIKGGVNPNFLTNLSRTINYNSSQYSQFVSLYSVNFEGVGAQPIESIGLNSQNPAKIYGNNPVMTVTLTLVNNSPNPLYIATTNPILDNNSLMWNMSTTIRPNGCTAGLYLDVGNTCNIYYTQNLASYVSLQAASYFSLGSSFSANIWLPQVNVAVNTTTQYFSTSNLTSPVSDTQLYVQSLQAVIVNKFESSDLKNGVLSVSNLFTNNPSGSGTGYPTFTQIGTAVGGPSGGLGQLIQSSVVTPYDYNIVFNGTGFVSQSYNFSGASLLEPKASYDIDTDFYNPTQGYLIGQYQMRFSENMPNGTYVTEDPYQICVGNAC